MKFQFQFDGLRDSVRFRVPILFSNGFDGRQMYQSFDTHLIALYRDKNRRAFKRKLKKFVYLSRYRVSSIDLRGFPDENETKNDPVRIRLYFVPIVSENFQPRVIINSPNSVVFGAVSIVKNSSIILS